MSCLCLSGWDSDYKDTVKILNTNASKCEAYFCWGGAHSAQTRPLLQKPRPLSLTVFTLLWLKSLLCSVAFVFGAF